MTDTENPTHGDVFQQPIQVEAVNTGRELAVANQLPAVDVRVSAPIDRWEELTSANFRAFVDLNGFDARSQDVRVQVEVVGISGVRVLDTEPRSIVVNLEDLVTKEVPVNPRVVGTLPTGYELESVDPVQEDVTVQGPESLVDLVTGAIADVNVIGLTVGVEQTVALKALGAGGSEIRGVTFEPSAVAISIKVAQTRLVRSVPLTVQVEGEPDPGYRVSAVSISPPTVQFEGSLEDLQQVETLALPPVSVDGARSDVVRSLEIPLPDGLDFADAQRVTVTISIEALPGTLSTSVAPEVTNLASGLQATVEPRTITVDLTGPLPILNALDPADLGISVDANGLTAGEHQVTVSASPPEGVELVVRPGTVTLTITQP